MTCYKLHFVVSVVLVALATPFAARADGTIVDVPFAKTGGTWTCNKPGALPTGNTGSVTLVVTLVGTAKSVKLTADYTKPSGDATEMDLTAGAGGNRWSATIPLSDVKADSLRVQGAIDGDKVQNCQLQASSQQPAIAVTAVSSSGDSCADQFLWSQAGKDALGLLRKAHPSDTLLVQLPSGAAASVNPLSLSERQKLQFAAVVPIDGADHSFSVTVTQCSTPVQFRLEGSSPAQATFEAGERGCSDKYTVVAIPQEFNCGAGTLSYNTSIDGKSAVATSLTVRPVYQAAATFLYGFDTTRVNTFQLTNGKVAETSDKSGTSLLVGYTWFPWGLDPGNLRWFNRLFNLFVVVDPKTPTDGFAVGLALLPGPPGISLALGASFHKQTVLNGVDVGDTISGSGAVPTTTKWSGKPGFLVGISLDSNVFDTIKSAWQSQTGSLQGSATTSPATTSSTPSGKSPSNGKL